MADEITQKIYRYCLLIACLFGIVSKNQVSAYYCDSNRCGEDEYCCGNNQCCTSYMVLQNWYFWFGFVSFLILLSACASFWRYRLMYYRTAVIIQGSSQPYTRLPEDADVINVPECASGLHSNYAKYATGGVCRPKEFCPPPPYSQVVKEAPPPPPYSE